MFTRVKEGKAPRTTFQKTSFSMLGSNNTTKGSLNLGTQTSEVSCFLFSLMIFRVNLELVSFVICEILEIGY